MSEAPLLQWLEQQGISVQLSLLSLLFVLIFIFLFFKFNKPINNNYNLPPSPSKLPLIGNLHQLGSHLHRSLGFLAQKHGPLMLLHLGRVPTVVVSSPSAAKEIMKIHDLVFLSRPESRINKRLMYDYKDIAGAPYGEYWRQVRKICVLQLLSMKRVQSFRSVREEETELMIERIQHSSSSSSLMGLVDLSETLVLLTNSIICRVALGRKYYGGEGGRRFKEMIGEFLDLLGTLDVGKMIPLLSWVSYINGVDGRVEKNFRELDCFLERVVEEHMERKERVGGDTEEVEDLVDVLLGIEKDCTIGIPFARDNIKAIILDMFAAGTDTTYTVIEWAMAELIRHPKVMKELQKEVRGIAKGKSIVTEDDTQQMYYLKSVIKETLRLHPPVPLLIPRESTETIKIQGYDIPAKTTVIINAWAIGRDPMSWEDPEEFWPERFLNDGCSIDFKGQDFQLIPFGSGRRGCPGILFAIGTIELALANLLNKFDWELPDGKNGKDLDMSEGIGVTIHMKSNLVLIARPQSHSY